MDEINQAMNQLLDKDSPTSQRRNVITKPVGVNFEKDFRKLTSATETVKQTLEVLSQVQRLQPFVDVNKVVPKSELQTQLTSNRQVINTNKFQTAEAVNFISNATLRPTPDSSVTPGYSNNFQSAKLHTRRPYSGGNPSAPSNRLIDTEKLDEKNYKDDQRQVCGTLTPNSDKKNQQNTGKISNVLFELQNSQSKSKRKLLKSNSSTTRNADIENILKQSESVTQQEEDNQKLQSNQQPEVKQDDMLQSNPEQQTPQSTQNDYTTFHKLPEQHAVGVQTPLSNQFPIPLVSEAQIGHTALLSNKTHFSHIAWNISFMKQDSYDPLNSKEKLSHLYSDRLNQVENFSQVLSNQKPYNQLIQDFQENSDINHFSATQTLKKQSRPVTSRPALVNLNSHHKIETAFQKQTREREMIRTLSTAQVNKLSVGAIPQTNQQFISIKKPQSNFKSNSNSHLQASVTEVRSNFKRQISTKKVKQESVGQRDQPIKIQLVLSQVNEENLKLQPIIPQLSNYNIKVLGKKLTQVQTSPNNFQQRELQRQQQVTNQSKNSNNHQNDLTEQDQRLVTEADNNTTQSQKQTKQFFKPNITSNISVKHSPKNGPPIKYELTSHLEYNLKEVQTLKKDNKTVQHDQLNIGQSLNFHQESKDSDFKDGEVVQDMNQKSNIPTPKQIPNQTKGEQWRLLAGTPFTELCNGMPQDQTHIGALNSNFTLIPKKVRTPKNLMLQTQKTTPKQRKSFTTKVAQLARLINAQSESDQVQFKIKYENLMQKHSRKSWLPDPTDLQAQKNQQKKKTTNEIQTSSEDKPINSSGLQKALNAKNRPHPLAFLDQQLNKNSDKPLQPIQIVKVTRPRTTKTSCRVALIQEKEAPLPPPSIKDQKRIGADINFLRKSEQFSDQKQQPGLSLIDLRLSNYQLVLTTSQPQSSQVMTPTQPRYFQEKTLLLENSQTRKNYSGQVRDVATKSNLFRKVTHNVK